MNKRLKRQGIIGLAAIAALTFTLPVHAQDEDEIKKNNAKGDTLTFNVSDFVLPEAMVGDMPRGSKNLKST